MAPPLESVKAALDPSFQFDPNSDLSYDDQLTAHQYEKNQWPTDLAEFEQKQANIAAIKAALNRPDQRVHPSQDSPVPDFKKFELEKAVYDLNNPDTSDERLLSIYENELQGHPGAQERFKQKFPNLINSSPALNVKTAKEQILGTLHETKNQAAFKVAQEKFQKPAPKAVPTPQENIKAAPPQEDPTTESPAFTAEAFNKELEEDLRTTDASAKQRLIDSIYVAEGGENARIPFGMFTKELERKHAAGDEISREEVEGIVSKHLDRHIKLWENNKTRNVEGSEERGLTNANPDKLKAITEGKWNEGFLKWYGEIYAPVGDHPLNKNWVKNVSSGDIETIVGTPAQSEFTTVGIPKTDIKDSRKERKEIPLPIEAADFNVAGKAGEKFADAAKQLIKTPSHVQEIADADPADVKATEQILSAELSKTKIPDAIEPTEILTSGEPVPLVESKTKEIELQSPKEPSDISIPTTSKVPMEETTVELRKVPDIQKKRDPGELIKDTSLSEQEQRNLALKAEYRRDALIHPEKVGRPLTPPKPTVKPDIEYVEQQKLKSMDFGKKSTISKLDEEYLRQTVSGEFFPKSGKFPHVTKEDLAAKTTVYEKAAEVINKLPHLKEHKSPIPISEKEETKPTVTPNIKYIEEQKAKFAKEDPTLIVPKTKSPVYGPGVIDPKSPWAPPTGDQLAEALHAVPDSTELAEVLREPDYMKQTSPVTATDGVVAQHANGTWSTTVNGVTLPGLDEVTARSFAAYTAANERALEKGAPLHSETLHNYFNMFMQSWAIPGEMGASAFVGEITLTGKVADFNKAKRSQPLLNDPNTDILPGDVKRYTNIQKTKELSDSQQQFKNTAKYKTIEKLHLEALKNRAELDAIHEEAEAYRNLFPVNDADFQGAIAAGEVIAKNQGTTAAMWYGVSNNLVTYMEQGIGSIGFMVALTAGGPPVQLAMLTTLAKGRANQAIAEFQDREKRDPNDSELSRINWASAAGVIAEKVSAGMVVKVIGKMPGIGGQLAWVKKVKGTVDKNIGKPLKTYTNSLLHRGVTAPIGALASEGSQGAATSIAEQYAQTGAFDVDEVKMAAFHEAIATPGAAAGMIATSGTYRTAKGGIKFVMDPRGRGRNKANILNKIEILEAQLNSDTPVQFGETEESKPIQDQLAEVEEQIEELKDKEGSSVILERAIEEQQRLIKILEAPASGDASAQLIKDKEIALNKLKKIRDTEDYSNKSESALAILKGDPKDGTTITDEELDKTLKELDLGKYESTREKLTRLTKRALTPENKKTVLAWLDKNIDRTLNAVEPLTTIFGSLEDSLDPDKLSIEALKALREKETEEANVKFLNAAIALRELGDRLRAEAQDTLDKSLEEVDVEALEGKSSRWKGLDTYRQEILDVFRKHPNPDSRRQRLIDREVQVIKGKMTVHANNLSKKYKAFVDAYRLAKKEGTKKDHVWTVKGVRDTSAPKGSRVMKYTVSQTQMKKSDFTKLREDGEFIWEINTGRGSTALINALKLESNFGKAAIATVDRYEATSIKQRKEEQQIKIEDDAELASMLADIRDAIGEPVIPLSQEDLDRIQDIEGEQGETTDTQPEQKQPEQLELLPEDELPERVTPVRRKAPKTPKQPSKPAPKPGEKGYQSTLFDEEIEDEVQEESPTETVEPTVKDKVTDFMTAASKVFKTATKKFWGAYESVITKENINPKKIYTNLENMLGLVGVYFQDLIEIDPERPEGLHTLTDENFRNDKGVLDLRLLKRALRELGMSKLGAQTLASRYQQYEQRYQNIVHEDLDSSGNPVQNYAIRQPLSILLRKDNKGIGRLPDQILFGMMVGTLRWADENRKNIPFRSSRDREAFMYKDESPLSSEDAEQMEGLGFNYQQITSSVGRNIARMMAMSQKKTSELDSRISKEGASIYYENFRIALGLAAFQIAHGNVDGTQKTMDGKNTLDIDIDALFQIKKQIWNFKEANDDNRHFNNAPTHYPEGHSKAGDLIPENEREGYKHIIINETARNNKDIKRDKLALDELNTIIDQELEEDSHHPLKDPPSVSQFIKGTIAGRIPKRVKKTLEKLQKVVWTKADAMTIFAKLHQHGHEAMLYALADKVEYNDNTHHKNERMSLESSNLDKTTAIDEIIDSYNNDRLDKFHFKYELQNHHRIMMKGRLNPQNSKVTRFLVKSWGSKTYNQKNLWKFKLAVAHLFEFKVDKHKYDASAVQFDQITADPNVIKAVTALVNLEKGIDEKQNADKLAKLLTQLKSTYGVEHGTSLINGVTALARYMPDGKPKTTFESDVVFEIDGITNGFAMTVLQFPLFGTNLEKVLNQIGVYFGKDNIHDPKANDVYEDLIDYVKKGEDPEATLEYLIEKHGKDFSMYGRKWKGNYTEFKKEYKRRNNALMRLYPDFRDGNLRSLVKYPFMIFMYGGGIKSISEGISKDIVKEMYKELGRHARIYQEMKKGNLSAETKQQLDQLKQDYNITVDTHTAYAKSQIASFLNDLETLDALPTGELNKLKKAIDNNKWTEFKIDDVALTKSIATTLAPRFDYALNEMLGETKLARDAVVQAGEILHAVFLAHYNKAYQEALVIPADKEKGTPKLFRKSLTRNEIIDLIKSETSKLMEVYPQYAGPLSSMLEDGSIEGFIDLTKTQMTDKKNIPEFVEYVHDEKGRKKLATSAPSQLEFVVPGVSALIRQIINMDSVLLTQTLETDPQLLMLHDAFMGSPEQLSKVMETYGKLYLDYGMKHSVLETTVNQLNKVIEITEAKEDGFVLMKTINEWLRDNAHVNKHISKEENIKDLKDLRDSINIQLNKVIKARADLNERRKKEDWQAFQMYMPVEDQVDNDESFVDQKIEEAGESAANSTVPWYLKKKEKKVHIVDTKKDSLLKAIAKLGGIAKHKKGYGGMAGKNQFGDFGVENHPSYASYPSGLGRGFPVFRLNSGGLDVDEMRLRLLELGYLTDPDDINEIFDKVQEEIGGNIQWHTDHVDSISDDEHGQAYEKWAKDQENSAKESLNNLPRSNEETIVDGSIDTPYVLELFELMRKKSHKYYSSKEAMEEHSSILNSILIKLADGMGEAGTINFELEKIDGLTQGRYETARNKVRVSVARQAPLSRNGQSPQEVYVHEFLHAMTSSVLNDRPLIASRIANLYEQTEKNLNATYGTGQGYKVFLPTGVTPSSHDKEMAEKQYNYLFDNPRRESNKLHEFLAYAVTNPQMINFLKNQEIPKRSGLLGKLLDAVTTVIDAFREIIGIKAYRSKDDSAHMEMVAVMEHLVAIQSKHQSLYKKISSKGYDLVDASDKAIQEFGDDQTRRYNTNVKTKLERIVSVVKGAPIIALSNHASALWVRDQITKGLNKTLRGIANEIGAGALSKDMIQQLLQAKVNVSKARQEAERFTIRWFDGDLKNNINSIWKSVDPKDKHSMSSQLKEALTDIVFRTDLSSLRIAGISSTDIVELIGKSKSAEDARDAQKSILIKLLKAKQPTGLRPALKYAQELGYHVATGRTKMKNGHMNAYTIVQEHMETTDAETVALLDAYATLYALDNTDPTSSKLVRDLAENEFAADSEENGIIDLLDSHLVFKEESIRDLFKDNPTQSVKGYIVERVDNLTRVKTGTRADKEKMRREGYTESYALGKIDQSHTHDVLYVSRNMPEVTDVSGIMSTTNQRNMGTTLTEIFMRDPKYQYQKGPDKGQPNFIKIKGAVRKFIAKQEKDTSLIEDKNMQQLRPIRDETGRITDYRVMMANATKKQLLRPDLEIQNVFAHMRSGLVDRRATLDNDLATVELLVHEQEDMMKSNPDLNWVDIMDPDGPYIDRFRKLPRPIRQYIKQFSLDGTFMVREDIVDKVFGYKQFDVTQLKVFQDDKGETKMPRIKFFAGLTHYLIRQIVGYGKDRIVIAMPKVVIGNMMSNVSQLLMRKIPLEYILYKTYEGIKEYGKYRKDTEEKVRLEHRIKAKGLDPDNSDEARDVIRLNSRIENNKLHRMTTAGLNSLIVEDVNDAMIDGYFNRMKRLLKLDKYSKYTDKIPNKVGDVAATLFMTKSSKPYQLARQTVQLTDFLGRYVMIEHATNIKGQDFNSAMHEALDAFVLFDEALVPALEAVDAVGATSFISYYLRNARASRQLVMSSPTSVGLSALSQHATGLSTLGNVNSSWIGGKFTPNTLQLDDLFDEANNMTLVDIVSDTVRSIFN